MKVLISTDIEGVAGVTHPDQTRRGGPDYDRARLWMVQEANAAIAGNATGSVRQLKAALKGATGLDLAFDAAFGGAEFAEGLAAFRERRNPVFP